MNTTDMIIEDIEENYAPITVASKSLAVDTPSITPSSQQKKVFHSTIAKFEKSQKLKNELIPYLQEYYPSLLGKESRKQRIKECCNSVSFRRYLLLGKAMVKSIDCSQKVETEIVIYSRNSYIVGSYLVACTNTGAQKR